MQDLDGFIKADPEDRYSRLAVVELLLERPEVESYITRILEPLPDSDPDALALRINLAFNLGRFDEAERLLARRRRITRGSRGSAARWPCGAATSTRRSSISATP